MFYLKERLRFTGVTSYIYVFPLGFIWYNPGNTYRVWYVIPSIERC